MRIFPVLLVCLALATCSSHLLLPEVTTPAQAGLRGHHSVQLITVPARAASATTPQREALLASLLRDSLSQRGYQQSPTADLRAYYWLGVRQSPLTVTTDLPPPGPLGPYLSVHRLQDENATVHLRLTDLHDQLLWEGQIDTGLSPSWSSDELLRKTTDALVQQVPLAR